ncbi:MAG TPA: Fic/DOC family N-terminal domain-containing protein [Luteibacter sp.]|nr:Fic/DOC family N-terminal domain-containing protein [Luteibacter sp.]
MRKSELSADRQRCLVRCGEPYTNCRALVPPATPRNLPTSGRVSSALHLAHEALGRLQSSVATLPNTDLITRTLARREAVQSSQIEGTQTQLPELFEYEATQGTGEATADAKITERYVVALKEGLDSLQQSGRDGLSIATVKRLHAVLMQDATDRLRAGEWRDTQAWIGAGRIEDATFVPPPPSYIDACMQELEHSMLRYERSDDEHFEISVIARLAITHAQFETIHPFADGNGRVGRLLMPLMLAENGYPPLYLSGYLLRRREAYYDSLADIQLRNRWEPWVEFLCRAVVDACDASLSIALDMNAIASKWLDMLGDLRVDAASRKIPRLLLGHPVTSINEMASLLDTSFQTASTAIDQLVARGILNEVLPQRKRNRIFHATELLARLEDR